MPSAVDTSVSVAPRVSAPLRVERLYDRHHRQVFRLALRYGCGHVAWAEDIAQEVFLAALGVIDRLDDVDDLGGWFYRVTTNRCLNRLRRDRLRSSPAIRWLLGEQRAAPPSPEATACLRSELLGALAVLDTLPAKERVAFSMHHLDGKDQIEIARLLGHSKGYVSKLIQRAEQRIRASGWRREP